MALSPIAARANAPAHVEATAVAALAQRPLKNRLQARFPTVKSTHLSEAIARGQGFQTHAALRAALDGPDAWQLQYPKIDVGRFRDRLIQLGYPLRADLQAQEPGNSPQPSEAHKERVRQLKLLQESPKITAARLAELRMQCAEEFAQAFGLGRPEHRDGKRAKQRWSAGVDHGACLPGWGRQINVNHAWVEFPGSDHRVHFCQALPLAGQADATYTIAMVSMPYLSRLDLRKDLDKAALLAGQIGWQMSEHPEWAWHNAGETTLVLFRRTTPHSRMLEAWPGSFKRWLVDNKRRLMKSAGDTRRKVIADIIDCQHVPLDLVDFEDCGQRYLKEFAGHLYYQSDAGMAKIFERLMEAWSEQRHGSTPGEYS